MLRPKVKKTPRTLIFQAVAWKDVDEIRDDPNADGATGYIPKEKRYMLRVYGVNKYGNSVSVDISGYQPHFYVKPPTGMDKSSTGLFIAGLRRAMEAKKKKDFVRTNKKRVADGRDTISDGTVKFIIGNIKDELVEVKTVRRKELYWFQNEKEHVFYKLIFKGRDAMRTYASVLESVPIDCGGREPVDFSDRIYESNLEPLLRSFHERGVKPAGWLAIKNHSPCGETRAQISVAADYKDVYRVDKEDIAALLVLSFDLECDNGGGDGFPQPSDPKCPVIQIGDTSHLYGESTVCHRHIITLGKCTPIGTEEEPIEVECVETEKQLILGWAHFVARLDPDIITGYNINGFDWKYLYERAKTGNGGTTMPYHEEFLDILNRRHNEPAKYVVKTLSSSALGDNRLFYVDIEGVVNIDLMKVVQRDFNLGSYKLDAVAEHFTGERKIDLKPKEIFAHYAAGTPDDMAEIAKYCVMDCVLVNHLIIKLEVLANNIGMANVCLVPLSYLFMRGQGVKIFSLVADQCRREKFLIKVVRKDPKDVDSYEGAIVFPPKPGIYFEPVAVNDYSSLYPRSMMAENISHDTLVWIKKYDLEGNLVQFVGDEAYDNLPDYEYNDITYDWMKGVGDDKTVIGQVHCRYALRADGVKGVLPRILQELLDARGATKKRMKHKTVALANGEEHVGLVKFDEEGGIYSVKTPSGDALSFPASEVASCEDTYSPFMKGILDGLQLAYKLTCNSLYGQVGAKTSQIYLMDLAASTTATGRMMMRMARDMTLENFPGSRLIYGDTDSNFVSFKDYIIAKHGENLSELEMLEYSRKYSIEAAELVTMAAKPPHILDFEKVLYPLLLFSKKRYVAYMFSELMTKSKLKSMGIVLKRRDNAPILKEIYQGVIDIIMNERNMDAAIKYFKDEVNKLLSGDIPIQKLIITKSLSAAYANPTSQAHKMLAVRMVVRDPGNAPVSNDRIPYVYIALDGLKCGVDGCIGKIKKNKGKCLKCTKLFCPDHLEQHSPCEPVCWFCAAVAPISQCPTCTAWYCVADMKKHRMKKATKGPERGTITHDRCKKPLTNKVLGGDLIEHPDFIRENGLKIDYTHYYTNQLCKPILQIFGLEMERPESIMEAIDRKIANAKKQAKPKAKRKPRAKRAAKPKTK